jgi:cyclopropane-fatty-acyl-phospholipid synthase
VAVTTEEEAGYVGASPASIQHHYDLSNDFFALWLDESMTYSCALWQRDDEPFEVAQARKLDYIIEAARLPQRARVLDIGCGWGSMMRRLIEHHGVSRVVGLTLSSAQAQANLKWMDGRYEVRVENWIDHHSSQPYDGIVSIGAFEHFARFGLPRVDRIAAYRAFFVHCADLLVPRGCLGFQTIYKGGNKRMSKETVRDMKFVIDRIFPQSELPWMAEIMEASQGVFELSYARSDPEHYARTCKRWHDNLSACREKAELKVGSSVVEDYLRYLRASASAFADGHLGLLRASFERVRGLESQHSHRRVV